MTVKLIDNIGIVVDDIGAAIEFFIARGLELKGALSGRSHGCRGDEHWRGPGQREDSG